MEKISGARSLMIALEKEGVEIAFGLPGGANLPIYDELYKSNIRHVLVRHEQSASHMADGFGRVSRRPGVCFATSGPGATNIVTGIATAQADSAPMIAITGQVPSKMIGRDAFQESDIIGITNPIVKYAFQPMSPNEIPEVVKKAFYIASTGRPGPVLIDIPKDVQQNVAEVGDVKTSLRIMVKMLIQKAIKRNGESAWAKRVKETKEYYRENLKIHPHPLAASKVLKKLREVLPAQSIVTTEVGQHQMWASLFFDVIHPGTFFSSTGLGTMGWGFPAAIGAKAAKPDVPVLDMTGE